MSNNNDNNNNETLQYYKNEAIYHITIFGITFLICFIILFFSYQKSIGNFGFLEQLSPYARSFYYVGPEWIYPVPKSLFLSSLCVAGFVLIIVMLSKFILYMQNSQNIKQED